MKSLALLVLGAGFFLTGQGMSSAHACQLVNRGDLTSNEDCGTIIPKVYREEAKVPNQTMIREGVFASIPAESNPDSSSYGSNLAVSFIKGSLCLMYFNGATAEAVLEAECLGRPAQMTSRGYSTPASWSNGTNFYEVRQLGDQLLAYYGIEEKMDTAKPEQFLVIQTQQRLLPEYDMTLEEALKLTLDPKLGDKTWSNGLVHALLLSRPENMPKIVGHLGQMLYSEQYSVYHKFALIEVISALNDTRGNQILMNMFHRSETSDGHKQTILKNFRTPTPEFIRVLISSLSEGKNLALEACERMAKLKLKSAVIPLIDILEQTNNSKLIVSFVTALGEIGSTRALQTLNSERLYKSANPNVRRATQKAIEKIETTVNLDAIRKGESTGLTWGEKVITYSDGSNMNTVFDVLSAMKEARNISSPIKERIDKFLISEIQSGYHDYDVQLMEAMKSVINK